MRGEDFKDILRYIDFRRVWDDVRKKLDTQFSMDTADIVAVGILILAIAAALVAVIVGVGFVLGRVDGTNALKIIGTCVGGSTISGIVAALVGRKSSGRPAQPVRRKQT